MRCARLAGLLAIQGWAIACSPKGPAGTPTEACRVRLPPRAADAGLAPSSTFAVDRSTVRADVEIPFASMKQALEAKIGRRVAEERDHDMGVAGRLEYTVDRGPFAVSVQGDALAVEAPLDAHARLCAKGQCYAGCDPQLRATARVPMRLGADYKFRPSSVRIEVVRGCELRALGGFLRVDVTPVLQGRIAPEQKRIEQQIDRELPDLRPEAERLWSELGKPRALPLGGCVVVQPEGIVQGPPAGVPDAARLRLGILARPELRLRCGEVAPSTQPLPPLSDDPSLAPDGDVHLAVVLAPEAAAVAGENVDLGSAKARIARASGSAAMLSLALEGEVCGDAAVRAGGATWDPSGRAIHLAAASPLAGEAERFAPLDPAGVARAVERTPIAVPFAAEEAKTLLPELARSFSDPRVTIAVAIRDAHAETAGLRGAEPVAVVLLRGVVTLRTR